MEPLACLHKKDEKSDDDENSCQKLVEKFVSVDFFVEIIRDEGVKEKREYKYEYILSGGESVHYRYIAAFYGK